MRDDADYSSGTHPEVLLRNYKPSPHISSTDFIYSAVNFDNGHRSTFDVGSQTDAC